jgi:hypothetical protein
MSTTTMTQHHPRFDHVSGGAAWRQPARWTLILCVGLGLTGLLWAADPSPTPPDLTAGGQRGEGADRILFPGVRGWFYLWNGETTHARQALVTQVKPDSPWRDLFQVGDVILGVDDQPFTRDAARTLSAARQRGEVAGQLNVSRWRAGKTETVTLKFSDPPDFTRGGQRGEDHDWTLGPTGLRGWIYSRRGHTAEARQILVTAVAPGSPAAGLLRTNDVILGVGGKLFDDDARIQFAKAITAAEVRGVLTLTRWRDGITETFRLKLPVLGAYRKTAPYACAKSAKIFEQGCRRIAQRELNEVSIPNDLNALALLASGQAEYRPRLAEYAKQVAEFKADGFATWYYGYANMFLAEYVMATGDQSVFPGVERMALEAARGQSAVGTWGHKFARPDGNLNGYGCMNQPGLTLMISMVLARQAGVKNPEVDRAIAKGASFLRWYVHKGSIPYGDHQPGTSHENNGMCATSAILFDLLGDREAAEFFAKMTTAAHGEREGGHTGNFFNMLWALPGVARGGLSATGAYWPEHSWYYDLARKWDGSFDYQGAPVGHEEHGKYTKWDSTGAYLLAYALPRKSLVITGKKPSAVPVWNRGAATAIVAAGRKDYAQRPTQELLTGVTSWSPAVRHRSAEALAKREGDFVPILLKWLAGTDREARYGAVEALGALGVRADAAAPVLRELLQDSDPWLQTLACKALMNLSEEARRASVNDLLALIVRDNPNDPRRMAQRAGAIAVFARYPGTRTVPILATSLDGVDRAALLPAVARLLQNDDSVARGSVAGVLGRLTDRELATLLPAIVEATEKLAPSNEMFADGIRLAGLDLLSRRHIREGLALCVAVIEPSRWGAGGRAPKCLESLLRYGIHAKEYLPQLREMRQRAGKEAAEYDQAIAALEATTDAPVLVDLKTFIATATAASH